MATPRCHPDFHPRNGRFAVIFRRLAALGFWSTFLARIAPASPPNRPANTCRPQPDKSRAQKAYQAGTPRGTIRRLENCLRRLTPTRPPMTPANKEYPLLREHARFQVIQGLDGQRGTPGNCRRRCRRTRPADAGAGDRSELRRGARASGGILFRIPSRLRPKQAQGWPACRA